MLSIGGSPYGKIDRDGYSLIRNHGMICNNRTAALVSMNGTIDWACLPHFNSDPVFSSILDNRKGGYFQVTPMATDHLKVIQYYHDHTNILITEFYDDLILALRVTDFLPTSEYSTINFPEIHRYLETPNRDVDVKVTVEPVFDYGRIEPAISKMKEGFVFRAKSYSLGVSSDLPLKIRGRSLTGGIRMKKGEDARVVVLHGVRDVQRVSDYQTLERMEETSKYWKDWVSQGRYPALYNRETVRSALVLKGLFYEPTGLMVAAPTSSLPECIGGERNWDYRFTWIRDTAYVVESLAILGYKREAIKFLYDIMETVKKQRKLKTIYQINEHGSLEEETIDYSGYMDSQPVRMGNQAATQLQIDEYGSIINAIYFVANAGGTVNSFLWDFVRETLAHLSRIWQKEDSSIWEFRTAPRHYTFSKAVAWVAFRRAIEMGRKIGFTAPYSQWQKNADLIRESILANAVDRKTNSFAQYYGSQNTDGALLRIPHFGILPPNDGIIQSTVKRIEDELMTKDFLFRRYTNDDGLKCPDNAFLLLSYWYVEDLVLMREYEKAREVFDHLQKFSNHLYLMSEEVDLESLEPIGNFPQAMSHLGLIRAAKRLNDVFKGKSQIYRKEGIQDQ